MDELGQLRLAHAGLLLVLYEQANKLHVRLSWLLTMQVWGNQVDALAGWGEYECKHITARDRKTL